MSVCFFVPAADGGATSSGHAPAAAAAAGGEPADTEPPQDPLESAQAQLQHFWNKVGDDVRKVNPDHFKNQVLPLARIKKIMKLDEEVKMISAEAPVLFAKAAEIFIHELTLRAWAHTEDNKRRTLQRNDIAMAISKSDQFDFLIDIVPRHEVKPTKPREEPPRVINVVDQVSQHHQPTLQSQVVVQPCGQIVQQAASAAPAPAAPGGGGVVQQPVTLMQHIVTPSGEVQQMPIQLTQAQLNMIRMQMQNNPNQPILIQAQQQAQPQIIQVASQPPGQQQVYVQVATSQEDS